MHLLLSQEHSNVLKFAQCDMIMIYADSIISKDENPKPSTKSHVGLLAAAAKSTYATGRQ